VSNSSSNDTSYTSNSTDTISKLNDTIINNETTISKGNMPTVKPDQLPLQITLSQVTMDGIARIDFSEALIIPVNYESIIDSSQIDIKFINGSSQSE
jgi:hypothetical protein